MNKTKICNKCGRELPFDKFRLMDNKESAPYYLGQCKECEYQRQYLEKKNKIKISSNLDMLIDIQYKKINSERILDLAMTTVFPIGTDEIFIKLMDYKSVWMSNYGRVIRYSGGSYNLLQGSYDGNRSLHYHVKKNVYFNGKWIYEKAVLYAAKAVVEEFIVNPDKENNIYIWHSGNDKEDCYYRNLYPLNQEQYKIVRKHFKETGDDTEFFIMNVINEQKYKPNEWSKRSMKPTMCGIGYWGKEGVDCKSKAYIKWHDMMNRCYNEKFLKRQPQYRNCKVCEEWKNFSNFKVWYESNIYGDEPMDLDKDILFKGNMIYSAETCCLVPHVINTLFLNGKAKRGELPMGVYFDKYKGKYCASMAFMGKSVKLGTFCTAEEAFARYKEYKEDFIKDMAELYKEKIPDKVYQAMMNWEIEITD